MSYISETYGEKDVLGIGWCAPVCVADCLLLFRAAKALQPYRNISHASTMDSDPNGTCMLPQERRKLWLKLMGAYPPSALCKYCFVIVVGTTVLSVRLFVHGFGMFDPFAQGLVPGRLPAEGCLKFI